MFIQRLDQKFSNDQNNIMIEKQASTKLLILSQKKDKNFYIYYCQTKTLLIGISVRTK